MSPTLTGKKYDDADFHYGSDDFPKDLEIERGATHIGMFLGWAIERHLEGDFLKEEHAAQLALFRARKLTGRHLVWEFCDEVLTNEELNDEGNAFANACYETYLGRYATLFEKRYPSTYHVEDTWNNFDAVCTLLDSMYADWKKHKNVPGQP